MNLKDELRHAFSMGSENEQLTEEEERLLDDLADRIHKRGLTTIAIPILIANRPLNVLGANMVQMGEIIFTTGPVENFLKNILGPSYSHKLLVGTLEKRCSIDRLVEKLEARIE